MTIRTHLLLTAALVTVFAASAHAEEQAGYPRQFSTEARRIVATHCLNCGASEGQAMGREMPMTAPVVPEVVHFASASDRLDAGAKAIIKKVAADLKTPAFAEGHVIVRGFTDSQGKEAQNQRLSFHRALAVVKALEAEGVPAAQLTAQGFGADAPIGDNKTAAGRALNRRVTFEVVCPMNNPDYPRPMMHDQWMRHHHHHHDHHHADGMPPHDMMPHDMVPPDGKQ